jgi:hypothetical protein
VRPHTGRLRVTLDPSGNEYFSEPDSLRSRFAPPASWRRGAEPCGENADSLHLLRLLEQVDVDRHPALKAVEIGPRALTATFKMGRADRGTYRVLRSANFRPGPASDELVEQVLSALREIENALEEGDTQP